MNVIHQMQRTIAGHAAEIAALREGIHHLRCYLDLPKFSCGSPLDGYVNRNDVLLRLSETTHEADRAADEVGAAFNEAHAAKRA